MIYALADLHLDYTNEKSMEIFGEAWANYQERIFTNRKNIIKESDTVLIPGDISRAMDLYDAKIDLKKIDDLPGTKILMKGNHDYRWTSLNKINNLNFSTLNFLQNNSFHVEGFDICGTRGRIPRDSREFSEHDEKVFKRELQRLENSLKAGRGNKKIVMLHYPPLNLDKTFNEFYDICKGYDVDYLIYGHLHGSGHNIIKEGKIDGIYVICVAADYVEFKPVEVI